MIQIWKLHPSRDQNSYGGDETAADYTIISIQDTMENAQYFCKKNRLEDVKLIKVTD